MSYLFGREDGRDFQGKRHLNKGGGGGGSSGVYYANQDKLLGVQADIAQNMYNTYADYAPNRLDAMNNMVNEAMDGRLADRARGKAAADAGTALSTSLAAAGRNLSRYGTTLNASSLSANLNDAALMGAANRTGAMNRANEWAEGQKWARNSDMYSTLQGMPGNATQALGQAASGYGQMAGQMNQVNMANAMGYGQMGGMIGYGLMAKDGGYIHDGEVVRYDDEPGFAAGGMPKLANWRDYPTTQQNTSSSDTGSAIGQVAAGAAPALAMYGVKNYAAPYIKQGLGAIKDGVVPYVEQGVSAIKGALGGTEAATAGTTAAEATTAGTTAAEVGSGLTGGTTAALETGGTMAAGTGAVEGAAAAAGAAEAAGTASLMGPIGWTAAAGLGVYALGNAMDWWADGGPVPHEQPRGLRKNMIPGGHVQGPGTETSDSIPAWLSDGEYVLNADAVKEVGKDKLEKMNQKGLKKRAGKAKAPAKKTGGLKKPVKK